MLSGKFARFIKEMIIRYQHDEVPAMGAQLTFYLILSFFPFLIFLLTLLGYTSLAREEVLDDLFAVLPSAAADLIVGIVNETVAAQSEALLSFAMIGTIWAASKGVTIMIRSVNKAYDELENRPFWKVRLIAIGGTLILALVIILSFVMLIFGKVIGEEIFKWLTVDDWFESVWKFASYAIPLSIMLSVFMLLYYIAPNREMKWREVWPGALFTTIGWVGTSVLFSVYINHFSNYTKTYGSIGGVIILLLWLYFSNIIIMLGGEINAALSAIKSGKQRPDIPLFTFRLPFSRKNK